MDKSYSEKLKDPRWQKKRLEIMQRDEFMCQMCGENKKQLNVHHRQYKKDTEIWDYDNDNFITLCSECHNTYHKILDEFISLIKIMNPFFIDIYFDIFKKISSLNLMHSSIIEKLVDEFCKLEKFSPKSQSTEII